MKRSLSLIICVLAFFTMSDAQAREYPVFRDAKDVNNVNPSPDSVAKNQYLGRFTTDVIPKCKGPTIELDYGIGYSKNTIDDFMYFIPLVSPALVESRRSMGNRQTGRITSFKMKCLKSRFRAICEFEISGTGYLINKYDPASMIAEYSKDKRSKILKQVIDYIKVQGQGTGSVEVLGKIVGGKKIVDEIKINFNKRSKDLLCIGLYDVNLVGGKYDCSSRFNQIVVRVSTLGFKRTSGTAKMEVKVSSVAKANERQSFLTGLRGAFANMFMEAALEIDKEGNQVMLDFGRALFNKQRYFTFPRARNMMNDNGNRIQL